MTTDRPFRTSAELFTFDTALVHSPGVEEWFANEPQQLFSLARQWFTVFRECGDDVNELLHDGCPTACINGAAFGYVNVFKAHINVGFYTGAFLDDPHKLLQGSGKRMRHAKIRPGDALDSAALKLLINAAYRDVRQIMQS